MQWALRSKVDSLEFEFTWPVELAALKRCFLGYRWALALGPEWRHVMGICQLQVRPPHDLMRDESAIFEPRVHAAPSSAFREDGQEYFLIVDLMTVESAQAYLSMLVPPNKWYLLDQHRVPRESMQAQLSAPG